MKMPLAASLIWIAAAVLAACPALAEDEREPVPAAGELAKAEATVKEIFKDEYAKTKAADRLALAGKLLAQAEETSDDAVSQFVLLREARDLAAKAGDPTITLRAATAMSDDFKIGAGAALAPAADTLTAAAVGPPLRVVADSFLATAAQARTEGDIKSVLVLLKAAEVAARKTGNLPMATAIRAKIKDAEALKADADAVDAHLATLEKSPEDPAANLAVGRYLCLLRGDWKGGVPLLGKGGDAKLKEVAAKDQAALAGGTAEQFAAGDAWYDYAATDSGFKAAAQGRAYHWYETALPALGGLQKVKAETRLKELQSVAADSGAGAARFALIRKALADKAITRAKIVGGAFTQTTYEELPAEGAILIGFNYTTVDNGRYPGLVQAIYATARGEVAGKIFGKGGPGDMGMGQTTKAKPGYAVGAIYTRGGGGFDAFKPIYMRMTDKGLDPKDSYEGPHIGGMGGGQGTLGGDGQFIIGIHGKIDNKPHMEALSPISVAAGPAAVDGPLPKKPKSPKTPKKPLPKK